VSFSSTTTISEAIVLAAGLGTRLKPFTNHAPKALMPLLGIPLLEWVVRGLVDHGVEKVVVNVHAHAEQVERWLKNQAWIPHWRISDERNMLLGSAGGPKKALSCIEGERFFLVNADTLCFPDWSTLTQNALNTGDLLTLLVIERAQESSYTGFLLQDDRAVALDPARPSDAPYYSGVGVFTKSAFQDVGSGPQEFTPSVLLPSIQARKVGVAFHSGIWLDVGTPVAFRDAHEVLLSALEGQSSGGGIPDVWHDRIRKRFVRHAPKVWSLPGLTPPADLTSGFLGTKDLQSIPMSSGQFLYSDGDGYCNGSPGIQAFGEFA
jgi:NDP-sugar pyrophosphorylase family protein